MGICEIKMQMKLQKEANKTAKIGTECICPSCGTKFIKKAYNQVFCKTKRGTICKNAFWNFVDESKRNNTTRISPANAAYYEEHILPNVDDDGIDFLLECGSWD